MNNTTKRTKITKKFQPKVIRQFYWNIKSNKILLQMKSNIREMKKIDLRTPLQRERAKRDIKIHSDYKKILLNVPKTATKWAIYRTLAELYGLQPQGIRSILEKEAPTE